MSPLETLQAELESLQADRAELYRVRKQLDGLRAYAAALVVQIEKVMRFVPRGRHGNKAKLERMLRDLPQKVTP